jgi:hypothetical protein
MEKLKYAAFNFIICLSLWIFVMGIGWGSTFVSNRIGFSCSNILNSCSNEANLIAMGTMLTGALGLMFILRYIRDRK